MSNLEGVKAGDELFALPTTAAFVNEPVKPRLVTVHRVDHDRKVVHILLYPGTQNTATLEYQIEDGLIRNIYASSQLWKPAEWAERAKQIEKDPDK